MAARAALRQPTTQPHSFDADHGCKTPRRDQVRGATLIYPHWVRLCHIETKYHQRHLPLNLVPMLNM
jgi:hypothetical protein